MSEALIDELMDRVRAETLLRGEDWLREMLAKILEEEAPAAEAQDVPPCARRVRFHEHRSPSPVPRTRPRLRSPPPLPRTRSRSPMPRSRSRIRSPSPVPRSRSRLRSPSPVPRTRSRLRSPSPGPRSRSRLRSPSPVPRTRSPSPVPRSRSRLRSPSPVPRTRPRLRSPSRDPPGAASWQCPASEVPSPGRNPFPLDTDLRDQTHAGHCDDVDLRPPLDSTSQNGANSGPSTTVAVTVSVEDDGLSDVDGLSDDDSGQHYSQPEKEVASSVVTAEESDAARIERVLRSCSAAINLDRRREPARSMPVSLSAPDCQPCLVWILGDSFVASARKRLSLLPEGCQLGFPYSKANIRWLGRDGMKWDSVRTTAIRQSYLDRPPDILIVHAGADDLGIVPLRELVALIKYDMTSLQSQFSQTIIVWSDIVNRPKWPRAQSKSGLLRCRVKVNHATSKFLREKGMVVIRHKGLEDGSPHLFEENGISLNSAGIDIWCIDIQEGIDTALQLWKDSRATRPSRTV